MLLCDQYMKLSPTRKATFQKTVWDYYQAHNRADLPWRKKITPYRIWISEVMLQQTQVGRVVDFFNAWMKAFPTIRTLADAPQIEVLKHWKGLGYNSRALRLKRAAEIIIKDHGGKFPKTLEQILKLPGIGPYTAGAIMAFAHDEKVTMIETNIRRAYLHHFFRDTANIHDREILQLIEQTLPDKNFREWYWALMDYGSYLGRTIPNPNKRSRHYTLQKKFEGSDRQIRGAVLEVLLRGNRRLSIETLYLKLTGLSLGRERIDRIVSMLEHEGFVTVTHGTIGLKK